MLLSQKQAEARKMIVMRNLLIVTVGLLWCCPGLSAQEQGDAPDQILAKAVLASEQEKWTEAEALLTKLIAADRPTPQAWYWRGRARFCQGKVKAAASDFDRYYEEVPAVRSRQWERGIALYYAERYEEGAKQFELYQTYHDSDVENATWKYLCEARTLGPEQAQARILEIGPDRRVPMRKIYELYAGKAEVDDVFQAIEDAKLKGVAQQTALFYAHLYVGLWFESLGKSDLAKPHLNKAGTELPIDHYMGWVGRVHWQLLDRDETSQ